VDGARPGRRDPPPELSAREVVAWHLDRIAEVNPLLNAIVSLRPEAALGEADAADRRAAADVLAAPSAQVAPFPVDEEYPRRVAGVEMPHYLGWMRACSRITVAAHPVAAVPAGFTAGELPVGLQLVGRYRGDRRLLEHAAAWEAATGLTQLHPPGV
jgi:amidase